MLVTLFLDNTLLKKKSGLLYSYLYFVHSLISGNRLESYFFHHHIQLDIYQTWLL